MVGEGDYRRCFTIVLGGKLKGLDCLVGFHKACQQKGSPLESSRVRLLDEGRQARGAGVSTTNGVLEKTGLFCSLLKFRRRSDVAFKKNVRGKSCFDYELRRNDERTIYFDCNALSQEINREH